MTFDDSLKQRGQDRRNGSTFASRKLIGQVCNSASDIGEGLAHNGSVECSTQTSDGVFIEVGGTSTTRCSTRPVSAMTTNKSRPLPSETSSIVAHR